MRGGNRRYAEWMLRSPVGSVGGYGPTRKGHGPTELGVLADQRSLRRGKGGPYLAVALWRSGPQRGLAHMDSQELAPVPQRAGREAAVVQCGPGGDQ